MGPGSRDLRRHRRGRPRGGPGPLMVGAATLPRDKRVLGVRDSKMLTEHEREKLFDRIAGWCEAWAVGAVSQEECDDSA